MSEPHEERDPELRRGLQAWFARPPGCYVAQAEAARARRLLGRLFGRHAVQIGALGGEDLLGSSRAPCTTLVDLGDDLGAARARVRARARALPLDSDSVDVALLAHVLEFEPHPADALREAFRVLVPEGHLLICGFNPLSLLGLARLAAWPHHAPPWCGHFLGLARLRDWLDVLGFTVVAVYGAHRGPPLRSARLARLAARLDAGLDGALLAGTYVVLARKRVITLTPLRVRWRPKPRAAAVGLAGGAAACSGE